MTQKTNPVPQGFHTATPYLIVKDITQALSFYQAAFGAAELDHFMDEKGNLKNIELKIGDSPIMISEYKTVENDPNRTLEKLPPISIYLYVDDADEFFAQAIKAGARELYSVRLTDYGNREGAIADPFGNFWWIATQIAEMTS